MTDSANLVPFSDTGWAVLLALTVVACVVWLIAVVLVTRYRNTRRDDTVDEQRHEPKAASRISARVVLVVFVTLAAVSVIVFLIGRIGTLA